MSNSETCLWRYAIVNGLKTDIHDAASGDKGTCPLCGNMLVARKGEIRAPHWWHKNGRKCDSWYEGKGPWHLFWQDKFQKEYQEICRSNGDKKHIADIFLQSSQFVVECQYSSMSPIKAREREDFYGNMIWIVNGTRVNHDKEAGEVFKALFKYRQEGYFLDGKYECCVTESDLWGIGHVWRNRGKYVFFDFDGTYEHPLSDTDVFCVLPEEIDLGFSKKKIIVKLSQAELVAGLQTPIIFLNQLRLIGVNYSERDSSKASRQRFIDTSQRLVAARAKCEERAQEQARKQEIARFQELANKTGRNLEDVKFEKDCPPLYAITLGWLDLWLFLHGHAHSLSYPTLTSGFLKNGTIALHNRNNCEAFAEKRLEIIAKYGLPSEGKGSPPSENSCSRHRGAITALARYEVILEEGCRCLVLSDVRTLRGADGQGRSIKNLRDGTDIWLLPKEVAKTLQDEQEIILGTIKPQCNDCRPYRTFAF